MNQTEKVARWCNEYYGTIKWDDMTDRQRETWLSEAEEILDLIDQQAEPVAGPVASITPRFQLPPIWQLLPGGYELEINLPHPLYLHPPASQEAKTVEPEGAIWMGEETGWVRKHSTILELLSYPKEARKQEPELAYEAGYEAGRDSTSREREVVKCPDCGNTIRHKFDCPTGEPGTFILSEGGEG